MTAYVILITDETHDPAGMETYRSLAPKARADGVEFVAARGAAFQVLEGHPAEQVVVLRFPDMEAARKWYFSPEYQDAVQHRLRAAKFRTVLVEGQN
jgi:uncharacterized protein (DUF1330 family)